MDDLSRFKTDDYDAVVIADSQASHGGRLTSILVTFPRFVLPEIATHRRQSQISMNSASSRAVPGEEMVRRVRQKPVIPIHFGKRQRGMAAAEELEEPEKQLATTLWLAAARNAADAAEEALRLGGHKQWTTRLLEPFLWHTVLLTGTEWAQFFHLRIDRAAQPEMAAAAVKIAHAYFGSTPRHLRVEEWHLPFLNEEEREAAWKEGREPWALSVSAGRCARLSYNTFAGTRDAEADEGLWERLKLAGHWSPGEHQGRPMPDELRYHPSGNFRGFLQHRQLYPEQEVEELLTLDVYLARLEGWIGTE